MHTVAGGVCRCFILLLCIIGTVSFGAGGYVGYVISTSSSTPEDVLTGAVVLLGGFLGLVVGFPTGFCLRICLWDYCHRERGGEVGKQRGASKCYAYCYRALGICVWSSLAIAGGSLFWYLSVHTQSRLLNEVACVVIMGLLVALMLVLSLSVCCFHCDCCGDVMEKVIAFCDSIFNACSSCSCSCTRRE